MKLGLFGRQFSWLQRMDFDHLNLYDVQDLLASFLELSVEAKKLQWYAYVNLHGFRRLQSKFDRFSNAYEPDMLGFYEENFAKQDDSDRGLAFMDYSIVRLSQMLSDYQTTLLGSSLVLQSFGDSLNPPLDLSTRMSISISKDDASTLHFLLGQPYADSLSSEAQHRGLCLALLRCAVLQHSRQCVSYLIKRLTSLDNDVFGLLPPYDNCIHWLVIDMGHNRILGNHKVRSNPLNGSDDHAEVTERSIDLLSFIFSEIQPSQRLSLLQKDLFGRLPLHYAALYGLESACELMIKQIGGWNLLNSIIRPRNLSFEDIEGNTPLHLAVFNGHLEATTILLEFHKSLTYATKRASGKDSSWESTLGSLLVIAIRSNFTKIVELLLKIPETQVNFSQPRGQSPLFCGSQSGYTESVTALIQACSNHKLDLNLTEAAYGWTP